MLSRLDSSEAIKMEIMKFDLIPVGSEEEKIAMKIFAQAPDYLKKRLNEIKLLDESVTVETDFFEKIAGSNCVLRSMIVPTFKEFIVNYTNILRQALTYDHIAKTDTLIKLIEKVSLRSRVLADPDIICKTMLNIEVLRMAGKEKEINDLLNMETIIYLTAIKKLVKEQDPYPMHTCLLLYQQLENISVISIMGAIGGRYSIR